MDWPLLNDVALLLTKPPLSGTVAVELVLQPRNLRTTKPGGSPLIPLGAVAGRLHLTSIPEAAVHRLGPVNCGFGKYAT